MGSQHVLSRLILAIAVLCLSGPLKAQSQEVIPPNLGTGNYPPGLLESTDLKGVTKLRINALMDVVAGYQLRYEMGLDNIRLLLDAQLELAVTQMESTDDNREKLQYLEVGLETALKSWQQAVERHKVGLDGGGSEPLARAAVFRMRQLWLKENARQDAEKKSDANRKDQHESK
jgi:hypothetical protein